MLRSRKNVLECACRNGTYQHNRTRGRSGSRRRSGWSWLLTPHSQWWPPPQRRRPGDSLWSAYWENWALCFDPVLPRRNSSGSAVRLWALSPFILQQTQSIKQTTDPHLWIKLCCPAACLLSAATLSPAHCSWISVSVLDPEHSQHTWFRTIILKNTHSLIYINILDSGVLTLAFASRSIFFFLAKKHTKETRPEAVVCMIFEV